LATREEPALRSLPDLQSLLSALRDREVDGAERNALVVALVRAAQQSQASEPISVLVVAFLPGLVRVCMSIRRTWPRGCGVPLEVLVLEHFVEVVRAFPLRTQAQTAILGLGFATRRAVIRELCRLGDKGRDPLPVEEHRDLAATTLDPEGALLCRQIQPDVSLDALHAQLRAAGLMRDGSAAWSELTETMKLSRERPSASRSLDERRQYRRAQRARHRLLHSASLEKVREQLSPIREHLSLFCQEGWQ
jgi:hypothetical protein